MRGLAWLGLLLLCLGGASALTIDSVGTNANVGSRMAGTPPITTSNGQLGRHTICYTSFNGGTQAYFVFINTANEVRYGEVNGQCAYEGTGTLLLTLTGPQFSVACPKDYIVIQVASSAVTVATTFEATPLVRFYRVLANGTVVHEDNLAVPWVASNSKFVGLSHMGWHHSRREVVTSHGFEFIMYRRMSAVDGDTPETQWKLWSGPGNNGINQGMSSLVHPLGDYALSNAFGTYFENATGLVNIYGTFPSTTCNYVNNIQLQRVIDPLNLVFYHVYWFSSTSLALNGKTLGRSGNTLTCGTGSGVTVMNLGTHDGGAWPEIIDGKLIVFGTNGTEIHTWNVSGTVVSTVAEAAGSIGGTTPLGQGAAIVCPLDNKKAAFVHDATANNGAIFYSLSTAASTEAPTASPTPQPTAPTADPTAAPSAQPTADPTADPTAQPTAVPTSDPTAAPSSDPTAAPTAVPTSDPTSVPTAAPSAQPTAGPTSDPTAEPTAEPSAPPSASPSAAPTAAPTASPTAAPTGEPTAAPTTASPTTATPTAAPTTAAPTGTPTAAPSSAPTGAPTGAPSAAPTTAVPTAAPTAAPTLPTDWEVLESGGTDSLAVELRRAPNDHRDVQLVVNSALTQVVGVPEGAPPSLVGVEMAVRVAATGQSPTGCTVLPTLEGTTLTFDFTARNHTGAPLRFPVYTRFAWTRGDSDTFVRKGRALHLCTDGRFTDAGNLDCEALFTTHRNFYLEMKRQLLNRVHEPGEFFSTFTCHNSEFMVVQQAESSRCSVFKRACNDCVEGHYGCRCEAVSPGPAGGFVQDPLSLALATSSAVAFLLLHLLRVFVVEARTDSSESVERLHLMGGRPGEHGLRARCRRRGIGLCPVGARGGLRRLGGVQPVLPPHGRVVAPHLRRRGRSVRGRRVPGAHVGAVFLPAQTQGRARTRGGTARQRGGPRAAVGGALGSGRTVRHLGCGPRAAGVSGGYRSDGQARSRLVRGGTRRQQRDVGHTAAACAV